MKPLVSLREALADPALLGGAIPGDSWAVWRALLIAAVGEPLTDAERALFTKVTDRPHEPGEPVGELWCIVGRRGGKTRAAGTLAAYVAALCDHSGVLASGERGVFPILSASTYQAGRAFLHCAGILGASPVLSREIEDTLSDTLRLKTRVDIEVRPANFKTIRSITAVGAVADEIAFWQVEGTTNPDSEILEALRPALATTGGPLVVISSPYAKRGELWKTWRRDYGAQGSARVLVAHGPSRTFNPTLPEHVVEDAYRRDAAVASAEYGGKFRTGLSVLLDRQAIEAVVDDGVTERAPQRGVAYRAFVDPSGGSTDSFTLAIAHAHDGVAVLDAMREVTPPFSPEGVVDEFATLLRLYGLARVTGDRYAGQWPREQFRKRGIEYDVAEVTRSEIYLAFVPAAHSGLVSLLDNDRLVSQLAALERRTSRTGRDMVDHPTGANDDLANAAAGAIHLVAHRQQRTYSAEQLSGRFVWA